MRKTHAVACRSARELWERRAAQTLPGAPVATTRPACGVDEAGRGCLAGPVVAAAVVLPPSFELPGLTDSKALSARRRAELAPAVRQCATAWGLGVIWPRRIDKINILQATFEAMALAVRHLATAPGILFIDGNRVIPDATLRARWRWDALPLQEAVVGGDASVDAVAAASILAKTFRDGVMERLARRWPGYGFERHKGYGTKDHYAALRRLGPCPMHRLTYRGVAAPEPAPCVQGSLF